jgi:pimeloyl-ACP methyl ester carboxylesterase
MMQTDTTPSRIPANGHYAAVNGLNLYYEIHGTGAPLVLLHGGLGATEMFSEILPALAACGQVIGVDLQAHGRTADIDRPMSLEAMGDDVAAVIKHLGLDGADVMGYSLGGGAALLAAIRHPEVVKKLVLVSTPFKKTGWYPEVAAGMAQMGPEAAEMLKPSPIYQLYARIAPRPGDFPRLLGKMSDLLRQDYDWTREAAALQMPVMIVVGDADAVRTAYAVEMFELLGGGKQDAGWDGSKMPKSRLAILPGTTHYNIFNSPALAAAVIPFLSCSSPASAK